MSAARCGSVSLPATQPSSSPAFSAAPRQLRASSLHLSCSQCFASAIADGAPSLPVVSEATWEPTSAHGGPAVVGIGSFGGGSTGLATAPDFAEPPQPT